MVDYKKKYLKYKKKYLAIKKLKGGMKWANLKTGIYGTVYNASKLLRWGEEASFVEQMERKAQHKWEEDIKTRQEEERTHMIVIKEAEKIFKLYGVEGPTQFPERIGLCEGLSHSPAAFAKLATWQYEFDKFVVIVNNNYDDKNRLLEDTYAERLEYPEDIGKMSKSDIYSDHDALSMSINIPKNEEVDYPTQMKLITFNLEGFCWGNSGVVDEEWSVEYNQYRMNNVVSLLEQYVIPKSGTIFLLQEVVLKNAAQFPPGNKLSLIELIKKLNIKDNGYELIEDGLTGAIIYDNNIWELGEGCVIEILRHYVETDGSLNNKENKKSNAYRLTHKLSGKIIIVVNIHLKAGLLYSDDDKRKSELAYIYNTLKNESNNFEIPVYFGGDWNSPMIDHLTLVELEKIINDPDHAIDQRIVKHLKPPQAEAVQVEEPAKESQGTVLHGILSRVEEEDWLKV
tara:strand:- start:32 stop:1399 length:1368 start_codon:yes stop_codon:yes gene_type:complete